MLTVLGPIDGATVGRCAADLRNRGRPDASGDPARTHAGSRPLPTAQNLSVLVVDVQSLLQNSKAAKMVRNQIEQKRVEYMQGDVPPRGPAAGRAGGAAETARFAFGGA